MTDILDQEGITFNSGSMASTHPTSSPSAITAPKIDMENAPGAQTIPQVDASVLQPPEQGGARQRNSGSIPPPPAPSSSDEGAAAAGAAPPQPQADILDREGITAPEPRAYSAFNRGVSVSPGMPQTAETQPVADFAAHQAQQDTALGQQRFAPTQLDNFVNNPRTIAQAIQDQQEWPDVPRLLQKYNAGEPLDQNQENRLNEYMDATLENNLRGLSWGGSKALTGNPLPAAAQSYITQGSGGQSSSTESSPPPKYLNGNVVVPTPYTPARGERPLNDYMAVTDKGQQLMAQAQEKPASTAMKMLSFDALPPDLKKAFYDSLVLHDPNAKISDLMTRQGYTKAVDELGEEKTSSMLDWFRSAASAAAPMTFEEHQNAQWQGEMLPVSEDQAGKIRFDPRAGITAPLTIPGDVASGNIRGEENIKSAGQDIATNLAMMEFGNRAGARMEARGEAKAAPAAPAGPPPTVDDYLSSLTPSKDQAMVDAGVVSVDGAKSSATVHAETILQDKGLPPDMAQETVANMTATEKDNFVAQNAATPKAENPTWDVMPPASTIPDYIKPHLLPDEPAPTGDPDTDIIRSQNAAVNAANPATIAHEQSSFNQLFSTLKKEWLPSIYAELFNNIQAIENLTGKARAAGAEVPEGMDTRLLTSFAKSTPGWIERNWTSNTTEWDSSGNQVVTGKGLKAIRDEFDHTFAKTEPDWKIRQADKNDYRLARTFIEDKEKNLSNVSPRDLERSVADLKRLADKYGDDFRMFEPFAKQEVGWENRILHNLVSSGLKSQEWYDHTTGAREWHAPTQRVVEQEFPDLLSSKALGQDITPSRIGALMQRKGSALDVKNMFQSQLRNSAIILNKAAQNKLRLSMKRYADFFPDEVKVSEPAVIRQAVKHSYDPKLREKLEQTAKFLGGEVKRSSETEKYGGNKKSLGTYEPGTKTTYVDKGTTEGTLTHEIGHMLDYTLDLKKRLLGDKTIKAELQKLAEDRLRAEITLQKTPEGMTEFAEKLERAPRGFMKYLKNDDEVLANFFDAWVNSPEQARRTAPKAFEAFEKLIDDNPQLAMLRDIEPSTARATETIQRELLDQRGPPGSIPVYEKGHRMYLEISKPLQKAFSTMTPMEIGMVERFVGAILGKSMELLKMGATSLPEFLEKHFVRSIYTSFLNNPAEKGVTGLLRHIGVRLPQGIFAVMSKNELYREWASSGTLRTFMDLSDKSLAKVEKDLFSGDIGKFLNPINWYKGIKATSDAAARIAVFKSIKEAGGSDLEAGLAGRDATGNYSRGGTLSKRINKYAPFFNDMMQGGDRYARSQLGKNGAGFTVKALATVTLAQIGFSGYYLYGADDQTRHEYLEIPLFDRLTAMSIKVDGQWKRIPRAFAPGFVYGALVESAMVYIYSKSHDDAPKMKDFWLQTLQGGLSAVSPAFDFTRALPPLFKSWIESTMNYSIFMQRPLFTDDKTKTAPEDQTNQYTTEVAKKVGQMLNISPINIDNTVYDMAAKSGRFAEQMTDMAINAVRKAQGQPVNEREMRPSDSPLYGGFVLDTPRGTNTESYQEFLSNLHDAQQAHNHLGQLQGSAIGEFQKENHQLLAAYGNINAQNSKINQLQKQIRNINKDTNIAGHDKTTRINAIQDTIGKIVEGANKAYRATTGGNQ